MVNIFPEFEFTPLKEIERSEFILNQQIILNMVKRCSYHENSLFTFAKSSFLEQFNTIFAFHRPQGEENHQNRP